MWGRSSGGGGGGGCRKGDTGDGEESGVGGRAVMQWSTRDDGTITAFTSYLSPVCASSVSSILIHSPSSSRDRCR